MTTSSSAAPPVPTDAELREIDAEEVTYGWVMIMSFSAAVVAITLAVCVLALVGKWWMLGLAIATHVGLSLTVVKVILRSFNRTPGYDDPDAIEEASRANLAKAGIKAKQVLA